MQGNSARAMDTWFGLGMRVDVVNAILAETDETRPRVLTGKTSGGFGWTPEVSFLSHRVLSSEHRQQERWTTQVFGSSRRGRVRPRCHFPGETRSAQAAASARNRWSLRSTAGARRLAHT